MKHWSEREHSKHSSKKISLFCIGQIISTKHVLKNQWVILHIVSQENCLRNTVLSGFFSVTLWEFYLSIKQQNNMQYTIT